MNFEPRHQRTIAQSVTVSGFGYWSGHDIRLEFRPAFAGTGVVFVRELPDGREQRIPATLTNRVPAQRRTVLAGPHARVQMVEHVLAALSGLRIDNCEVWCDAEEMPGCDGSSMEFVAALQDAGLVLQTARRTCLVVQRPVRVEDGESWVEARPLLHGLPLPSFSVRYQLDYGPGPIGKQEFAGVITPESFVREIATARTFLLQDEAEWLRRQGLGQRVGQSDVLIFTPQGPLGNHLRFDNECARHKALDVVGDLALLGCDLAAEVVAYRSGHELNARLGDSLLKMAAERDDIVNYRRCA